MKLIIDTEAKILTVDDRSIDLYSKEAFEILSDQWVTVGWNEKYPYMFSWMGMPIIQLPEDMIRIQEVISQIQPDVIIETGVAHGGSLVYYASICKAMNKGRVIGIEIEFRGDHKENIESHALAEYITLVEGGSTDPELVQQVKSMVKPGETVLVILDSNHTKAHVAGELEAYCDMVTPGSYIVATDGVMRMVANVPRGQENWKDDNPAAAAQEFIAAHPEFILEVPKPPFSESHLTEFVTHWPDAWLRRV